MVVNNVLSNEDVEKNLTKLLYKPDKNDIMEKNKDTKSKVKTSSTKLNELCVVFISVKQQKTAKKSKLICIRTLRNLGNFINLIKILLNI